MDPLDSQKLYSVGSSIHKSVDGGELWTSLNNPEEPSRGLCAFSLAIDPTDTNVLYLGTMEGIWKSTNGGDGWLPVNEGIPETDLYTRNVILDQTDPNILYAGISRIYVFQNMLRMHDPERAIEAPIYRSLDAGENWHPFSTGIPEPYPAVNAVFQHPLTGELFAATSGQGIYRYDPIGEQWECSSIGLSDPEGLYVTHIAFHPADPDILFCATQKDWIYSSDDGGASWQSVDFPLTLEAPYPPLAVFCAFDPANPDWVWASGLPGDDSNETPYYFAESDQDSGGLFLSTDGGETWEATAWTTDLSFGAYGPYGITFDPSDTVGDPPYNRSRVAYMGSLALTAVMKTEDGHETYTAKVEGENGLLMHTMEQHPTDASKLFASTEGVLHFSFDWGATWSHFTPVTTNPGAIWIRDIAVDPDDPDTLYYAAGEPAFENGTNKGLYELDLTTLDPGVKHNMTGPGTQFASTEGIGIWRVYPQTQGEFFLATQCQGILHSTDSGTSWQGYNQGLPETSVACLLFDDQDMPWFAGTRESDGSAGQQVFIEGETGGLYRWDADLGEWAQVGVADIQQAVFSVLQDPSDPTRIYAAALNGFYVSEDGGDTWSQKTWGLPPTEGFFVSQLTLDPDIPGRLYLSSFSHAVYLSQDGGEHWDGYREDLFPWYVAGVTKDWGMTDTLYAVTQGGSIMKSVMGNAPTLQVLEANDVPVSGPPYACRIDEEQFLEVFVQGADVDGSPITYSAYLNDGEVLTPQEVEDPDETYTFDPDTQTFRWKPPYTSSDQSPAELTLLLSDGVFTTYVDVEVNIDPIHPPEVDTIVANGTSLTEPYETSVQETNWLEVEVSAHDDDGDDLEYSAYFMAKEVLPEGSVQDPLIAGFEPSFDPSTRIFRCMPPYTASENSPFILSFVVSDGLLLTQVDVEVAVDPIHPPEVDAIIADGIPLTAPYVANVQETNWLEVEVSAHDEDGDDLEYSAYFMAKEVLPEGSVQDPAIAGFDPSFDPSTRIFRCMPPYTASQNSPFVLSFIVSDGTLASQVDVEVAVDPIHPPEVDGIVANGTPLAEPYQTSVQETNWLEVEVSAHDVDGDTLEYAAYFMAKEVLPEGSVQDPAIAGFEPSFDPSTRIFRCMPPYTASENSPFILSFIVSDGTLSTQVDVNVIVDPIHPPEVDGILANGVPLAAPYQATVQETNWLEVVVSAYDVDGDPLEYAAYFMAVEVLPEGSEQDPQIAGFQPSFDPSTRIFRCMPPYPASQNSPFVLSFVVSDGTLATQVDVEVVVDPLRPPVVDWIHANGVALSAPYQAAVKETNWLEVEVSAHDDDGDELEYSAYFMAKKVLPEGSEQDPAIASFDPSFDPATRIFRCMPPYPASQNSPFVLSFIVSDGTLVTQADVEVVVHPLQPPTVDEIRTNGTPIVAPYEALVREMNWLEVEIDAHDVDGDTLEYSAYFAGLPVPAPWEVDDPDATYTFDPTLRLFRWRPDYTSSSFSPFNLRFAVFDGLLTTQVDVTVQVDPPLEPVVDEIIGNEQALGEPYRIYLREMDSLVVQATGHDPEGGTITYDCFFQGQDVPTTGEVGHPPEYYSFDPATGTFYWIPLSGKASQDPYTLVFVLISDAYPAAWSSTTVEVFVGTDPGCGDCVPMSGDGEYGKVQGGDETHADQVNYSFDGMAGDVAISYQVWDVDSADEVEIRVNGVQVGHAVVTPNETWSGTRVIVLPDGLVLDADANVLTFNNTQNPPTGEWWGVRGVGVYDHGDCIPLPDAGAYGRISGGDLSHVEEVKYLFEGTSGDVTIVYEVWDVDFSDEVEILVNGVHIGYADVTENVSWGEPKSVVLPDADVFDGQVNTLTFNNTYNPPKTYWWGVRNVLILAAQDCADCIPLPDTGDYGRISGGDVSHVEEVNYSFQGAAGAVTFVYEVWDVDFGDEVEILINGVRVAYADTTPNVSWSGVRSIVLPDALVLDADENVLTFNNTYNPPKTYWWGVGGVSILEARDCPDCIPLPDTGDYGRISGGDTSHVQEVNYSFGGVPGDVTIAYEVWDMDFADEVEILVNGISVGYAEVTPNVTWSETRFLVLPDGLVFDSDENVLTFNNTYNPPKTYWWGVGNVVIE
jgi:photosystem II stability/assembly factor-like uncharacterized protein